MKLSTEQSATEAGQSDQYLRTIFEVSGEDSTRFLHAQLTSDIESQANGSFCWSSWLTPKGRVIAVIAVIKTDADRYILVVPASLASTLQKRLKMFVMRSNVNIVECQASQTVLAGTDAQGLFQRCQLSEPGVDLRDQRILVRFDDDGGDSIGWQIEFNAESKHPNSDAVGANIEIADSNGTDHWRDWCVRSATPWIVAETTEAFIPQSLNLDAVGGLSYDKGCYPGQEIVARTHFKGKIKYRMAILQFEHNPSIAAGVKLVRPDPPARSATILTVDSHHQHATAVVPLQWLEQNTGEVELNVQTPSATEDVQNKVAKFKLRTPPYALDTT